VDGWQYVDVVFRYLAYMRVHPDVSGCLVVRVRDSCVGSFVVHAPYVGLAEHGHEFWCYSISQLS